MCKILLVLLVVGVFVSSVSSDAVYNKDLLDVIREVGESATKLMDYDTQKDFHLVLKKIRSMLRHTELTNKQLSAANKLVYLISRRLAEGKIKSHHIRRFIDFALSSKLKMLLSTWDMDLMKMH